MNIRKCQVNSNEMSLRTLLFHKPVIAWQKCSLIFRHNLKHEKRNFTAPIYLRDYLIWQEWRWLFWFAYICRGRSVTQKIPKKWSNSKVNSKRIYFENGAPLITRKIEEDQVRPGLWVWGALGHIFPGGPFWKMSTVRGKFFDSFYHQRR